MGASSRYWNIWRIAPAGESAGFKRSFVPSAQEFLQKQDLSSNTEETSHKPPHPANESVAVALLSRFQTPADDAKERAHAGLCLRCYVSEPILNACQKIDHLFGDNKSFTYRDLLPFVLNDDGKTLIVLDRDRNTQLALDKNGNPHPTDYQFFSIRILQTFKPNGSSSMSLDNWAYLQTKQNSELKDFLSEFGFKQLSDWALLNRVRPRQIDRLAKRDRIFIEVFHAVYRRDRHQQQRSIKRCLDPSNTQLQEMLADLKARNVIINPTELMTELRQLAARFRQYDIWSCREPLERYDPDTNNYIIRADLPPDSSNQLDIDQQELLEFFHGQLEFALVQTIRQEICARITHLKKSKGYAPFAHQLIPGLHLYYSQGISLKEIAPLLGMTGWAQARRVLNPGDLLSTVRALTIRHVLDKMLKKAQEKGFTQLPPQADYLKSLAEQIEAIADVEIFQEAFEEIQAGKNRAMRSVYAQQLCIYLETQIKSQKELCNV